MKQLCSLTLAAILCIAIASCKKDNDNPQQSGLIAATVDADFLPSGASGYLWLTGSDGNILAYSPFQNGATINIDKPDGYQSDRVSLHVLTKLSDTDYHLRSYLDIPAGPVNLRNEYFSHGEDIGPTDIDFNNIPTHDYYLLASGNRTYSGGNLFSSRTIQIKEKTNWAYLYLKDNNIGYYTFLDNLQPGGSQSVSLLGMSTDMSYHTLSLSDGNLISDIFVFAYEKENDFSSRRTYIASKNGAPEAQYSYHLPSNSDRFKDFQTTIDVDDQFDSSKKYVYSEFGSKAPTFQYINADITNYSISPGSFSASVTGNYDYLHLYLGNFTNGTKRWFVYSKNGQNIEFPKVPTEITTEIPEVNEGSVWTDQSYYNISLFDNSNSDSFDDTIDRLLLRSGKGTLNDIKNYKAVYYFQ